MKLLHVTIHTDKFEEELKFYRDIVGLKITRDMRPEGGKPVFLADEEGDTEIEIIETPGAGNAGSENLSIGFRTENLHKKREELIGLGLEATPIISPVPQVRFFFVKDPAGVKVQFM